MSGAGPPKPFEPCPNCKKPRPLLYVKKEGKNQGRPFYTCTPCDQFQWGDEPIRTSASPRKSGAWPGGAAGPRSSAVGSAAAAGSPGRTLPAWMGAGGGSPKTAQAGGRVTVQITFQMLGPDRFAASSNIYHEPTVRTFKEQHDPTRAWDAQKKIWTYSYSRSYNALVEACRRIPGAEIHLIPPEVVKRIQEAKPLVSSVPPSSSSSSSSSAPVPPSPVADMLQKLPKTLLDKLMPFQRAGIEYALQRNARCLIGDEMGLGKTVQAIAIAAVHRAGSDPRTSPFLSSVRFCGE
eukprot:tig00021012_g17004.t1